MREVYAVWPDDDRMLYEEACRMMDAGYLQKSDDFITAALTEEQYDLMSYDEMVKCMESLK